MVAPLSEESSLGKNPKEELYGTFFFCEVLGKQETIFGARDRIKPSEQFKNALELCQSNNCLVK